jgi:hypothetical protein
VSLLSPCLSNNPLTRFDDRDINRFVREHRSFFGVFRDRSLQPLFVVAVREIGFVMRTARFITIQRPSVITRASCIMFQS